MVMKAISILLALSVQVFGRWENPIKVLPSYEGKLSIFTDNLSGISHIVYCSTASRNLSYMRVYPNSTVSSLRAFPWSHPCSQFLTLKGFDDRRSLYLVYQAQREATGNAEPCSANARNCQDVYFAESRDGGDVWTEAVAVPRESMSDGVGREEPQVLLMNNSRIWIFYKRGGSGKGNFSYVVRAPGSSVFTREELLPIHVSRVSLAYNSFQGRSILSIFHGLSNDSRQFRYHTENNGISWQGSEDVTSICNDDSFFISPFNSMSTPLHLFAVCKDGDYVDYLQVSSDAGRTWKRHEMPQHTCTEKIVAAGNGKDKGYVAYGELTVYYMKLDKHMFTRVKSPPVPRFNSCRVLTTSYRHTKFWFWFAVMNGENFDLWVSWNNLEEDLALQ